MAYNFKNALVNLNEEIRKSGGGGDLPAVKFAVSQLQVSMVDVKSSVASVSAEVDRIKSTLQSLTNITTTKTKIGTFDGNDLYRYTYKLTGPITINKSTYHSIDLALNDHTKVIKMGGCYTTSSGSESGTWGNGSGLELWCNATYGLSIYSRVEDSTISAGVVIADVYETPANEEKKIRR